MSEKVCIVANIDRKLKQKFKVAAAQNDVKIGALITQFIKEYVGETGSHVPVFEGFIPAEHIGN